MKIDPVGPSGGTSTARGANPVTDGFVTLAFCLLLVPAVLVASSIPLIPLVLGAALGLIAWRWPITAGTIPRLVTAAVALVSILAAALGFLS